ncbi:MAG TPA: NifB/NifX family molybdenum-iron cluster-binding protein [Rhizomicrobium sp.]
MDRTNTPSPTVRIAVASSDGATVDQHFGQATGFWVFDVAADGITARERRDIASHVIGDEGPRDTVCRMLADCKVLLVSRVGVSPQETLAKAGIEASDLHAGKPVATALGEVFAAKSIRHGDAPPDSSGFRLRHAMLRVGDMDRSVDFYTRLLGMRVIERRDHRKNQFTQTYLGYGDDGDQMALELVFNWAREEPYILGDAFGHIAVQV